MYVCWEKYSCFLNVKDNSSIYSIVNLPIAHYVCVPAIVGGYLPAAEEAGIERMLQSQRAGEVIGEGAHPGVVGGVHAQHAGYQETAERKCQSPHPEWRKTKS